MRRWLIHLFFSTLFPPGSSRQLSLPHQHQQPSSPPPTAYFSPHHQQPISLPTTNSLFSPHLHAILFAAQAGWRPVSKWPLSPAFLPFSFSPQLCLLVLQLGSRCTFPSSFGTAILILLMKREGGPIALSISQYSGLSKSLHHP